MSRLSAIFCKSPEFWNYFGQLTNQTIADDDYCTTVLKNYLAIESRAEIDNNESVANAFHTLRREYVQWQETIDLAQ